MKRTSRRRPSVHVTLNRAARLYRMVTLLAAEPRGREALLADLTIGLRTFYRELEFLRRCGVRIRLARRLYTLRSSMAEAEGRLPFPDPQLSFAEMAELSRCPGPAARRLAEMLAGVTGTARPGPAPSSTTPGRRRKSPKSGD